MREIKTIEDLGELVGKEVGTSDWQTITQERVNLFAEATGDHQWIHTDPDRARRESPFGGPVAHGFLTLSLLPALMATTVKVHGVRAGVNYGLNRVRFTAPLLVGARVRLRAHLLSAEVTEDPGGNRSATLTWSLNMEAHGLDKPVCVAESLSRLMF